jgi:hypothetical protein
MSKKPTRMEQLGNLLTAMIAVIVSGSSNLLIDASPIVSRHPELTGVDLRDFRRGGKYFGIYAKVARKLSVSRPSVCRTVQGYASERILSAVIKEIRQIDTYGGPDLPTPLSQEELSQFRNNGRYRGLYTRVARDLGMQTANVWRVGHGAASTRVLTAIRAEMARVDRGEVANIAQLTPSERLKFAHGGIYRGLFTRVAVALGQNADGVASRARLGKCSQRLLLSIRSEMARVDAELAAKTRSAKA